MVAVAQRPWCEEDALGDNLAKMSQSAWIAVRLLAKDGRNHEVRLLADLMHNLHLAATVGAWDWERWRAEAHLLLESPSLFPVVVELLRHAKSAEMAARR